MEKNLKINEVVFSTEIGETLVILNTDTGKYLELNKTAKFIWMQIEKNLNSKEILHKIIDSYDVTYEEAQSSLDQFMEHCLAKGLLKEEK